MSVDASLESASYQQVLASIVKRFMQLVGAPAALHVARHVPQLTVDEDGNVLDYDRENPVDSLLCLIVEYSNAFGDTVLAFSRRTARPIAEVVSPGHRPEAGLLAPNLAGPATVLLVDDHSLFREGMARLLSGQADIKVVGQAGSVREAVAKARDLKPEVVVMDLELPDGTGVEATQAVLAQRPTTKILFLTVHEDDQQLFAAIRAGAVGYLLKNIRSGELVNRLRDVVKGEAGLSPAIARRILDEFSRLPTPPAAPNGALELTARELEIVREVEQGATNRAIAQKFGISENTVKNHVSSVLNKLHLHSRRDLAVYARSPAPSLPPDPLL